MKKPSLQRLLSWALALMKRAFCTPSFWVILLIIPILFGALAIGARTDAALVTVTLYADGEDPDACAAVDKLINSASVLRFRRASSAQEAKNRVEHGESDAAWIFEKGFRERISDAVNGGESYAVRVVERENNVLLSLARERLFASLCHEIAFATFEMSAKELSGGTIDKNADLAALYQPGYVEDKLIRIEDAEGREIVEDENYLLSPARGLLTLLILTGGFAAAIALSADEREGVFFRLGVWQTFGVKWFSVFLPVFCLSAVSFVVLCFTGLTVSVPLELLYLLLFDVAVSGFCVLMQGLLRHPVALSIAAMTTLIAEIALTPIFFHVSSLRALSALFPSFHYLNAARASVYVRDLSIYTAAVSVLSFLPMLWRRRKL